MNGAVDNFGLEGAEHPLAPLNVPMYKCKAELTHAGSTSS